MDQDSTMELQIDVVDLDQQKLLATQCWEGKNICFTIRIRYGSKQKNLLLNKAFFQRNTAKDKVVSEAKIFESIARKKTIINVLLVLLIFLSACAAFCLQLFAMSVQEVPMEFQIGKWCFFILSLGFLLWKRIQSSQI